MAHIYKARVADTSLTTGLGPISVTGLAPIANMRTFKDVMTAGDTAYCCVVNRDTTEWEEGKYTYVGFNRLARTEIYESSNSDQIVDFQAGTKDVFLTQPAKISQEADGNISFTGSALVDFGSWPGSSDTKIDIFQPQIVSTSLVFAATIAKATVDHSADEHWVDGPVITAGNVTPGTGFTIYATSRGISRAYGKWSVGWLWR